MQFGDVLIRQAHPGPGAGLYRRFDEKVADAERYRRESAIDWRVLVDDLEGTVHQVYGGLADPTYLIDADGRAADSTMSTHASNLNAAIDALLWQGGRGVVNGGIDHVAHLLPTLTDGWKGIRRGLPQSYIDLELAAPGSGSAIWVGYQLRPFLAPLTLRIELLPALARAAVGLSVVAVGCLALQGMGRARAMAS